MGAQSGRPFLSEGLMNTQDFLQTVLPASGHKALAIFTPQGCRHRWFSDFSSMAQASEQLTAAGLEVFHALGGYQLGTDGRFHRKADLASHFRSFWFDLDVGQNKPYATVDEAATALGTATKAGGLPMPLVVSSGHGLHGYWPLGKDIPAEQWRPIAATLKLLLPALGLQIGPERTADAASILRPVGAFNRKAEPRPVTLVYQQKALKVRQLLEAVVFQAQVHDIRPDITVKANRAPSGLNSALGNIYQEVPVDADQMASRCAWVANARDHRVTLPEPEWYAMLGLVKHCTNPEQVALAWSEGHPGFTVDGTLAKLEQARNNATGPTLCTTLEGLNAAPCQGCPHKGKVKTPVMLGRHAPPPAPPESTLGGYTTRVIFQPPSPFRIDEQGCIWKDTGDESEDGGAKRLYPYPIMLTARRKSPEGVEYYQFSVGREDKTWADFELPAECLASPQETLKVFARYGVVGFNQGDLMQYAKSFAEDMKQRLASQEVHERLGWQGRSFVGPLERYTEEKEPAPVQYTAAADTVLRHITPHGTLEGWKQLVAPLARNPALAMGFLMGFAAPLISLTSYNGFLVHLYGSSGRGKTTVQSAAASLYGPWESMKLRAVDTNTAMFTVAGTFGSLPVLVDEITNMKHEDMSNLVYSSSEGRPRLRALRSGSLAENKLNWSTVFMTSANKSIAELLPNSQKSRQEAQFARIMEINFDRAGSAGPLPTSEELGVINIHINEQCGTAGPIWLDYVVHNQDVLREELTTFQRLITQEWGADADTGRYWITACALALVAAKHAALAGLFAVEDPVHFRTWMEQQYAEMQQLKSEAEIDMGERFGYFLSEHLDHTLIVQRTRDSRLTMLGVPKQGNAVYVRKELDVLGNLMFVEVSRVRLQQWLGERGWTMTEIGGWLKAQSLVSTDKTRVRIARGTPQDDHAGTQVMQLRGAHEFFRTLTVIKHEGPAHAEAS